jgi:hypothetical protein
VLFILSEKKRDGAVYKIDCNQQSKSFLAEFNSIQPSRSSGENYQLSWLIRSAERAATLPKGNIKKILWDAEGGYPEHALGFVQYSPRPFYQGYGCDGTTDENVHLIALTLCKRLGADYVAAYAKAYPEADEDTLGWIRGLPLDKGIMQETIIPKHPGAKELALMLKDLQAINNHSVIDVLLETFGQRDIRVDNWY